MATNQSDYASEFARKGAKARAAKLTKAQRQKIARNAANARWKTSPKKGGTHGR